MEPDVIFEDADIVVVNKPAGVYVHPSPGHEDNTLAMALAATRPQMANIGSPTRPGVVHRLDCETSGVMVFAKTHRAYVSLRKAFEAHDTVVKTYLAVLHGAPKGKTGVIETTIGRKPWDPRRMAVGGLDGKRAVTRWTLLGRHGGVSLVEYVLETGRTHQLRVHSAHAGTPIVGDALYGDPKKDRARGIQPGRHLLHAVSLSFIHPGTGKRVTFSAPPPPDIVFV